MKTTIAVIILSVLAGCSVIGPKVAPQVAKAVNRYCQEPLSERLVIREQVNTMITPNHAQVTCAGDPQ